MRATVRGCSRREGTDHHAALRDEDASREFVPSLLLHPFAVNTVISFTLKIVMNTLNPNFLL